MSIQKVQKEIKNIVFRYLDPKKDKVFIFGSRAIGDNRKFSDVDLGIISKRKLPSLLISDLEEALEESDIPYKVEVVDFSTVTKQFKNLALKKIITLN